MYKCCWLMFKLLALKMDWYICSKFSFFVCTLTFLLVHFGILLSLSMWIFSKIIFLEDWICLVCGCFSRNYIGQIYTFTHKYYTFIIIIFVLWGWNMSHLILLTSTLFQSRSQFTDSPFRPGTDIYTILHGNHTHPYLQPVLIRPLYHSIILQW